MRPVGIILVFMNLLFSIATCALIVVVYSTRANWKKEYDNAKNLALVAEAAYKSEKQSHENDLRGRDERITTLGNQITNLTNDIASAAAAKAQVQGEYDKLVKGDGATLTTIANLNAQVGQLGKELESLKAERSNREALIIALEKEKNGERTLRVDAQVKLASLQSRNERLTQDFSELNTKTRMLEKQLGGGGGSIPSSPLTPDVRPAPRGVTGRVNYVNERGLTEISIGSDSGVVENNVLYVVRYNPDDAKQAIYLGTLRITKAEAKKAIGSFEASPASRIKLPVVGDNVITSFNK